MDERDTYPIEPTPDDGRVADTDAAGEDSGSPGDGEVPGASPPATAPPPIATGPTHSGVRCICCGHDLSGTAVGALCPECGAPVTRSLGTEALPTSGKAITSMVLGICSIVLNCTCGLPVGLIGVVGIVYSMLAKKDIEAGIVAASSSGINVAGLVTSIIGVAIAIVFLIFILVVIVGGM